MINFESLTKSNCFLIDGTTARYVSAGDGKKFLAETPQSRDFDRREDWVRDNPWCRKSLELLAFLVMYDFAVVDSFALKMSTHGVADEDLIQVTSFPDRVITECGLELMENISSLHKRYGPSELYWLSDNSKDSELFEMPDKQWVDALSSKGLLIPPTVTHSNNSPARAFFYLELAARAGIPLLLSPQKDLSVNTNREKLRRFAHELVIGKMETELQTKIDDQLKSLFSRTIAVPHLPVSRVILRRARQEKRSLLDVATEIRNSTDAKSFRKWLAGINASLATDYEAGLVKAHAELKKLESLVDGWFQTGNMQEGVSYKRREFKIGEIPKLGWILKLAGINSVSINDPILNPNAVYRFISQWYSPAKMTEST